MCEGLTFGIAELSSPSACDFPNHYPMANPTVLLIHTSHLFENLNCLSTRSDLPFRWFPFGHFPHLAEIRLVEVWLRTMALVRAIYCPFDNHYHQYLEAQCNSHHLGSQGKVLLHHAFPHLIFFLFSGNTGQSYS